MGKFAFAGKIAEGADLHSEPMPGESIVEIYGSCRVLIENHRGVFECTRERFAAGIKSGELVVCGKDLKIALMTKSRLVVCGNIENVALLKGGR